jgi:hypothetical protein
MVYSLKGSTEKKVRDKGWNGKRSLRKASSVGDSHTIKINLKESTAGCLSKGSDFCHGIL